MELNEEFEGAIWLPLKVARLYAAKKIERWTQMTSREATQACIESLQSAGFEDTEAMIHQIMEEKGADIVLDFLDHRISP